MNLAQAQEAVRSNLAANRFVLSELEVASESIPQFLSELPQDLQFTSANAVVCPEEGARALRVRHRSPCDWPLRGIAVGVLQDAVVDLVLTEKESKLEPEITVSGVLRITGLSRTMLVTGTMSDPASWVMDFAVPADELPGFTEIASLSGVQGVAETLAQLNITLPTVTEVRFGFNISTADFTYVGLNGRISFGSSMLDVLCMFTPDLVILGKIPTGEHLLLADLLTALSLDPAQFPQVEIDKLAFSLHPASQTYGFEITLQGDWGVEIGNTTVALTKIWTEFNYATQAITAALGGEIAVDGTALFLEARLDAGNWRFSGGLAEGSTLKLRSVIDTFLPDSLQLPAEVPDMGCKDIALSFVPQTGDFSFKASSAEPWKIPVGVEGLSVSNINLNIERKKGDDDKSEVTGSIGGTLNIGLTSFTATYNFPGDFALAGSIPTFTLSPLLQDLCGVDNLQGIPLPAAVGDIELRDIAFSVAPQKGELAFSAGCDYGNAEIQIKRTDGEKWGFSAGFVPPEQWKLSAIDPALAALDSLSFANTALILASSEDKSFELTTIKAPRKDVTIKAGLNLFASLSAAGTGVDKLLGVESLLVYAAVGSDPRNLTLEAEIEGEFPIGESALFSHIGFRLQVAPPNFGVALHGQLRVVLDQSKLLFDGALGIEVTPPSFTARMCATMQGCWQDPCGAKGVAIANVALDLGLTFLPVRPTIGIAGSLQAGEFTGAAAVMFNAADPRKSMVAIAFNRLDLIEVFNAFCPPEIKAAIPPDIAKTVLDARFEDVNIYIVPQATSIGELQFEQGIALRGKMHLWGLNAWGNLSIDQATGILVQGEVDPIDLGVFKLTAADGRGKASLDLDLRKGVQPKIEISGTVTLLELSQRVEVRVRDEEFRFSIRGQIFGLYTASLEVYGSTMANAESILVQAAMESDFLARLCRETTTAIQVATAGAVQELTKAQRSLEDAKKEVRRIDGLIFEMMMTVKRERAQAEQDRNNSQVGLRYWQKEVNRLQRDIDSRKARINRCAWEVAEKRRWCDGLGGWDRLWGEADFLATSTARGAEISELYVEIASIEAAKGTAWVSLEAARQTLDLLNAAVPNIPLESDPRVIELSALKGTALTGLDAANLALEGVKLTLGGLAQAGEYIVRGGTSLLDIQAAGFAGSLGGASGGNVSMFVTVVYMGQAPQTLALAFNFNDFTGSATRLAKQLLGISS